VPARASSLRLAKSVPYRSIKVCTVLQSVQLYLQSMQLYLRLLSTPTTAMTMTTGMKDLASIRRYTTNNKRH
jgi:hypothetical protein